MSAYMNESWHIAALTTHDICHNMTTNERLNGERYAYLRQVCCSVLQCAAVCCSVLQRVAVCCSVL